MSKGVGLPRPCGCRFDGCEHVSLPEQRLAEAIWPPDALTPADQALNILIDALVDDLRMSRRAAERFAREHLGTVLAAASRPAAVPVDPDASCEHLDFHVDTAVQRVGTEDPGQHGRVRAFVAEIHINCGQCGERFRFMGVPAGLSYTAPAVSVDETEIRLPMRPASADPDFGLGIPGFSIRMTDPGAQP